MRRLKKGVAIIFSSSLLFAVSAISILSVLLMAQEPKDCTPKITCTTMARETCREWCGGIRRCAEYSVDEAYCEQPLVCYSKWFIRCIDTWEWFYYNCTEFDRTCKD